MPKFDADVLRNYSYITSLDIKDVFESVKEWQKKLGYDYDKMSFEDRMQQMRNYVTALSFEQAELLQELPWKPWRPIRDQYTGSTIDVMKEWIDCFFFLVDQALCLQLDPVRIAQMFQAVMDDNHSRVETGYNTDKGKL